MTPDSGTPEFDGDALATVARLRSRFRGALLGLALGEALAAPAQLSRPGSFAPVRDLLGGGPYDLAPGAWADDTAMSLSVARSLLAQQACDPADQRDRFRRWQRDGEGSVSGECVGITASVSRALVEGAPVEDIRDGADALVRVAPLAMWHYADESALRADIEPMARVTSHEAATFVAVEDFALMVQRALRGAPLADLCRDAAKAPKRAASRHGAEAARALAIVKESIHGATSWKDAVLRAINVGGDADVFGAATGQLAGASLGVESIPASWLARLADRVAIEELADALLADVLVRLESAS